MVRILLIDFVGACAGLIAITVGAHFKLVSQHPHSLLYTMSLYVMGTVLLLINLDQLLFFSKVWQIIRLVIYILAIAISLCAWRELDDSESALDNYLNNCNLGKKDP